MLELKPFGPKASTLFRAAEVFGIPFGPAAPEEGTDAVEELVHLLKAASEIEHSLMLEYLYAYFSLKEDAPVSWGDALMTTAQEEMGHLLAVQNLLLSLGQQPYLVRLTPENTPDHPFLFRLEALRRDSLGKYVAAEAPPRGKIAPEDLADFQAALDATRNAGLPVDSAGEVSHPVGLLYARIYHLLMSGDAVEGPWEAVSEASFPSLHVTDAAFENPRMEFQARPREGGSGDWPGVRSRPNAQGGGVFVRPAGSRAEALELVHEIAEQGEGAVDKPGQISHFQRFLSLFRDLSQTALPLPVRPLPPDPTLEEGESVAPERRITNPASRSWCSLLDTRYRMLLREIALTLCLPEAGSSGQIRSRIAAHAIRFEMPTGISAVVNEIILCPREEGGNPAISPCGPVFSEVIIDSAAGAEAYGEMLRADMASSAGMVEMMRRPATEGGLGLDSLVFGDLSDSDTRLDALLAGII